jgi:DNA-binding GntR family transcriptional regulator
LSGIVRTPLRDQVHRALVERILRDEMKPGSRLSDSVLAGELGVSRTPVREALVRLEREGFLEVDVGRGFFVKPLSAAEVEEVYPILWTLEGLAVRACPPPTPALLAELERINGELGRAHDDPDLRTGLDTEWHRALMEPCGNALLLETIAGLKAMVRRYEYAYMLDSHLVPISTDGHTRIAGAVAAGDREGAAAMLEEHWKMAIVTLVPWLEKRG